MDRYHLNFTLLNPIDDAVVAKNDLADGFNFQFRNNSPQTWVVYQAIGGSESAISEYSRTCEKRKRNGKRVKSLIFTFWFSHNTKEEQSLTKD